MLQARPECPAHLREDLAGIGQRHAADKMNVTHGHLSPLYVLQELESGPQRKTIVRADRRMEFRIGFRDDEQRAVAH